MTGSRSGVDISGWIAHWASWTPDKVALRFEGREIRYAELGQDVAVLAEDLRLFRDQLEGVLGPAAKRRLLRPGARPSGPFAACWRARAISK